MIIKMKGVNGILELYEDKVTIKRVGLVSKLTQGFTKGDKTIYIRNISGIDFKEGGNFVNGYIQFTLSGGNEKISGGAFQATKDENTVMFKKSDNNVALKIKREIESIQKEREGRGGTGVNRAEELRNFKELLDDGIISEEDFEREKERILGK